MVLLTNYGISQSSFIGASSSIGQEELLTFKNDYGDQDFRAFTIDLVKFNEDVKKKVVNGKFKIKLQLGEKYGWDLELWENEQIILPEQSKFRNIAFKGMANGIYAKNTSLKVTGCSFEDIVENGYNSNFAGYCIRAQSKGGTRMFQQAGLGKTIFSFKNCSKGIKVTGMIVDYIKDNGMRVDKGIELIANKLKVDVRSNAIQLFGSNSIGIELSHPDPSAKVSVTQNDVELPSFLTGSTAIQCNMMGLDPQGDGAVTITTNHLSVGGAGNKGIEMTGTNSAILQQNQVTVGDGATGCSAYQINSDFNSLLNCNDALSALSSSASDAIGFDINDAESTQYHCNDINGMGIGAYFKMGSFSPESFKENEFGGGGVGLRVSASAAIGAQTHKGNTWSGAFGGFGAQHESSDPFDWNQSRFTVHTNTGNYYPSLPLGQNLWFPQLPGTPDNACGFIACAQAGPTPPGNEEKFGFDDGIADYTFTISDHPTEIGWLAKRYLYQKLHRNPLLITAGSIYETFYNTERNSTVGKFVGINDNSSGVYNINPSTANQLDSDFSAISAGMETISAIDSQLIAEGYDSLLIQQRIQELQTVAITESTLDSVLDVILTQRSFDADVVSSQNSGVPASLLLESNKQKVNDIFLNTVAKEILTFTGSQLTHLQNIAAQCPLTGGTAVYEARSLLALVQDDIYDDGVLCNGAQARIGNSEITLEAQSGFRLFPNPAKDQVTLAFPHKFKGGEIVLTNHLGSIVRRKSAGEGSTSTTVQTGHLATGIYQVAVFENGKKVFADKLVIVH